MAPHDGLGPFKKEDRDPEWAHCLPCEDTENRGRRKPGFSADTDPDDVLALDAAASATVRNGARLSSARALAWSSAARATPAGGWGVVSGGAQTISVCSGT